MVRISLCKADSVKPLLHSPLSDHFGRGYNDPQRNIFLRMQDLDPISPKPMVLYKKVPPPDNMRLSGDNTVWFEYFHHLALHWDSASIPRFVPGFLHRMYGLSLNHFALRQSLMGQAAGYYAIMNQQSLSKSRQFLTQLLSDVQRAISTLTFDEGHLCAVLQLVKIYTQFSDTKGAHRHLQGLRLMVEHLLSKSDPPHPLVMCVWRAAIYFDMCFAFEGIPLALPSPERQTDETHRLWLSNFIPASQSSMIEYPLVQFELDDIEHQVMSLLQLRNASSLSPESDDRVIRKAGEETLQRLKEWMEKPLIQQCEREEVEYRMHDENVPPAAAFLHYPPLVFKNEKYALLLISYHSLVILTTLLSNPGIGPYPHIRFASAVTLCRIFAFNDWKRRYLGMGGNLHWHTHDLFRAGLVLGESTYPLGIFYFRVRRSDVCRICLDYRSLEGEEIYFCATDGG